MAESVDITEQRRKRRRKALTLQQRVKVIKRSDEGETAIAIANSLGVGKTQIQTIIKEKEAILGRWHGGESGDRKLSKIRRTAYTVIDEQVWEWFCEMRQRNIAVTGKLIREKALCLAVTRGFNDFQASNGWLRKWLKRHDVYQSSLNGEKGEIKQCSFCQTHKKQMQAPVVTPINVTKPIDPFEMDLMVRTRFLAQLMSESSTSSSSLEKYQTDTPEHIRGDPDVTANALSCLPEPENILPQCDCSAAIKEEICDDVVIKTEESDEDQIQTALPTPSDTDSNGQDTIDNNTFVITPTSCMEPDTETAQCLPATRTASEMLDGNIFVIASTPCTEPVTETVQCLPVTRTASEMTSRKLRQRYSHIGKGLRAHERERRLYREYMKSETDRNISEVKLNKVKRNVALLKKQKLQLQILMLQQRLNLQNIQTKNGFNKK